MPDLKTLMLLYLITSVINAGSLVVIWGQSRGRFAGISFWLVALALQAVGATLIVLRGMIPDLLSMVLANTVILAGVVILLIGLERFTGKRDRQVQNYVLLAVFIAVCTYFVVVQPNQTARDVAVSAMLMIYTLQCCWLLLRKTDPGMRPITRLTGIVFAAYAAFNFARIILNIAFPAQTNDFFSSGAVNALTIAGGIGLNVCLTISLILMVNRRLLADVKAQEEKFTTAFQSSPYAIILTRLSDGAIFEVNEGFVNITGYQYAEAIGKTALGLNLWVREEDRLAVAKELAQGREIQGVEYQFRKKTGEIITGLFSASLVTINNEKCILASIGDITNRKQAEDALRESEDRYRTLLENMGEGIGFVNPEEQFDFTNAAAEDIFGVPLNDLLGRSLHEFANPEQFGLIREQTERRRAGEKSVYEIEISRPNGEKRNLLVTAVPQFNSQGKFVGALGVFRDITERKQAEEALRESEEQYRILFETMTEGVVLIAPDGQILHANPTAERILRLKRSEIEGRRYDGPQWVLLRPNGTSILPEEMAGTFPMGRSHPLKDIEIGFKYSDGLVSWITVNTSPLLDQAGELKGVVGTFRDITDREQLKRETAKKITGELTAGIAHQIRNPLFIISLSVQSIEKKLPAKDPQRRLTQ
ncbi:MAG: PAS domain S-box protein, partial [Coprothermobacterota bacterium]|nr:PAS domain S-box protein [Coprothermobacterota bacterium]